MTDDDLPALDIGDHVVDRDDPDGRLLVVGLPIERAASRHIDGDTTVADVNPDYPETDHVVEAIYPEGLPFVDDHQAYAFPRSRLHRVAAIRHDDQDDSTNEEVRGHDHNHDRTPDQDQDQDTDYGHAGDVEDS